MKTFTHTRTVDFHETDAAGIVHFSVFFCWMEATEHAFLKDRGIPVLQRGPQGERGWPRLRAQCLYHVPVLFGDTVHIHLQLDAIKPKGLIYTFEFRTERTGDELCARGELRTTLVEREGADGKMRAIDLDPEIVDLLE